MIQYSNLKAYNQIWSPMGRYPMVDNSIFQTYQEALTFATTNSVAVVGSVITVTSDEDSTKNGVYQLIYTGEAPLTAETQPSGLKKIGSDIDLSNYVTKGEIASVYKAKGSVTTFEELPTNATAGDVYNVIATGKNYVWVENLIDGESGWDDLAGIVDLSPYALKSEVETSINTINGNIAQNAAGIASANNLIATKVDKVEGHSLISADKLALIDASAGQIGQLLAADESLTGRVEALEGLFKDSGSGGTIDLGTINTQIADHGTRLTSLESDNTANKTAIGQLNDFKTSVSTQLEAIVELNTQQTGQITGLTTELGNVKSSVSTHTTEIATLNTAVGTNTQAIGEIQNSINGLAIKSVSSSEKVLAADTNGVLSTTINLNHYKDETDGKTYVALTGIEGAVISRFDASDFVKDSFVNTVVYDPTTKNMTITWNTESGKQPTVIPMSGLVDTYTAGSGLTVANNEFAVRLSTSENNKLTLAEDGSLLVDITEDIAALEGTMDSKISAAFAWIDVQ